ADHRCNRGARRHPAGLGRIVSTPKPALIELPQITNRLGISCCMFPIHAPSRGPATTLISLTIKYTPHAAWFYGRVLARIERTTVREFRSASRIGWPLGGQASKGCAPFANDGARRCATWRRK